MQHGKKYCAPAVEPDSNPVPAHPGVVRPGVMACGWILAVALAAGPLNATAQSGAPDANLTASAPETGPTSKQGIGIQLGFNSGYKKAMLTYETRPLWGYQFAPGRGKLSLSLELGVSYWKARHDDPDSMWQISAIPIMRWWPTQGFFLEAGVGPTLLNRTEFAGHDLSTQFQFGSYLGVGALINDRHHIGVHYSHYSNANIKKPNPGLNVIQFAYTYRF